MKYGGKNKYSNNNRKKGNNEQYKYIFYNKRKKYPNERRKKDTIKYISWTFDIHEQVHFLLLLKKLSCI